MDSTSHTNDDCARSDNRPQYPVSGEAQFAAMAAEPESQVELRTVAGVFAHTSSLETKPSNGLFWC